MQYQARFHDQGDVILSAPAAAGAGQRFISSDNRMDNRIESSMFYSDPATADRFRDLRKLYRQWLVKASESPGFNDQTCWLQKMACNQLE